jgi:hypothetical protein
MPKLTIEYLDSRRDQQTKNASRLRYIAGILSITAFGIAFNSWWSRWGFSSICIVTIFAGIAMMSRALSARSFAHRRLPWIASAAVFGLWTMILLSNQFHGRPPRSDLFVIAVSGASCVLSSVGLAFGNSDLMNGHVLNSRS